MAVVLDTSIVVALMVRDEPDHDQVARWVRDLDDDLVTTPLAVAEMGHVVAHRGGSRAVTMLWRDLERGAYEVRWWADALKETLHIGRAEGARGIGLVDASLVALAERLRTDRIATLDHRHFRSMSMASGQYFTVLPADSP